MNNKYINNKDNSLSGSFPSKTPKDIKKKSGILMTVLPLAACGGGSSGGGGITTTAPPAPAGNSSPTGLVTITGTVTEDQVLTASNTLADGDGLGTISYQWQSDGTDISGANANTYTITQSDVGSAITVVTSYTDGGGTAETVTSAATSPVSDIPVINLSDLDGTNGFRLDGEAGGDNSGRSVSSAGDVNGDGYDDLIIGANYADPNGSTSGSSYVVFGKASAFAATVDLSTLDGTNGFRLDGEAGGDTSGRPVSSAGDINGDGYDDLIIGAWGTDNNGTYSGSSYVVFGGTANMGATVNLSTLDGTTGFRLDGEAGSDYSGWSVSSAGDINGDGYDDLIIGAWGTDNNGGASGSSYVVFGTASAFAPTVNLSTLDGTNGFRLDGVAGGDYSGNSVSSAGDVNGDGYDDLIIGANYADPNGSASGSSYVVFGKASAFAATVDLSTLDGTNGFRLDGEAGGDYSGRSVSSAGDINGDGYDDLIIGAYGADPNGNASGSSYVVFGGAANMGASVNLSTLDGTNGFRLDGEAGGDYSGWSVSSAGDVNGDGYDDLIIGAWSTDNNGTYSGSSYVVFGTASAFAPTVNLSTLDGTNGFRLDGVAASDSGASVFSAGDINGDGYDDLIIGANRTDINGTDSGSSYVVYGGAKWGASAQVATVGDDTVTGTAGADSLIGGEGNDTLNGAGGADVLRGGSGNDTITVNDLTFAQVDGGLGTDTLHLNGTGLSLDLTSVYHDVDGVEIINLTGTGNNTLNLSGAAISQHGGSNTLRVDGNVGDTVTLSDYINWTNTGTIDIGAVTYNVGTQGALTLQVANTVGVPTPASLNLSDLNGSSGFRLDGEAVNDYSGDSVSSAGDVNGDGYDDLIIGVSSTDNNGDASGSSYVVFGGAANMGASVNLSDLDGTNGFRLDGEAAGDFSGRSVSSAGDVNGDGYDDLIVGSSADPNGNYSGSSYVVFGKASAFAATVNLSDLNGTTGFRLDGEAAGDRSGYSVSSAGDVNGDGYDDLIIGADGTDNNGTDSGSSYVVFGVAAGMGATVNLSSLDGTTGFRLDGETAVDTVSSAGDINGDGYDDLIIGTPYTDINGNNSGSSYVVYGKASAFASTVNLSDLNGTTGFRLDGEAAGDQSSWSVSSAGDVNGDGYDDLIIGAWYADNNGSKSGSSYVVFGTDNAFAPTVNLSTLDGTNGFRLDGEAALDYSGFSVSSAGDVNGDGYDDLIIGTPYANNNGTYSGSSYVVFGSGNAFAPTVNLSTLDGTNGFRLDGVATDDKSGFSVSSAGDINGDGYDDLIIGAKGANNNGSNSGSSYVVYGGAKWGASAQVATVGDDTVTGTAGADSLIGGEGNDTLNGAGGADVLRGGSGNDAITVDDLTFAQVDGGLGTDKLHLNGTGLSLDLTSADHGVDGVEIINLTGTGNNTLNLSGAAISQHGGSNTLRVDGNVGDTVTLSDYINWTNTGTIDIGAVTYNVGTQGALTLQVANTVGVPTPASINLSDLNGSSGFRLDGEAGGDRSGHSVSSAGDVNGDGYDDLIIGAPYADAGTGSMRGSSYVVFGGAADTGATVNLSTLDGTNGYRLDGEVNTDTSGYSVSSAGDVNGDGYDDLVIGARFADPNESFSGSSYVVFGGAATTGAIVNLSSLDGTNGFRLDGEQAQQSGKSVSSAGDVNGDGYDDLIISASAAGYNGLNSGSSYVVFGGAANMGATVNLSSLDGTNGFRLDGGELGAVSGYSVSSAGDVNGDGYDDLIIGAVGTDPNGNNSGSSYVVFGSGSAFASTVDLSTLDGTTGFRLDGELAYDQSGYSVSSAGDVNGDGYDDLIIGANGADFNGSYSGSSYVVFGTGSAFAATVDLSTLDGTTGFRLDGEADTDTSGFSVSSAGDINGDGYDDLVIGANFADPNDIFSGSSYVVFGSDMAFATTVNLSTLDGTNGFRLDGVAAQDQSGYSVSSAGDVNGDGYDDLIIGAPYADPNDSTSGSSGSSYVVYGGAKWGTYAQVATVGDDTVTGTVGADSLIGGEGNDTLSGLADNDVLKGGSGTDSLDGGAGADDFYGGGNLDTFILEAGDSVLSFGGTGDAGTVTGYDTIHDFATGNGTSNSETLNTVGTATVVADTTGTDGTDSTLTIGGTAIKSHAIANGVISFDDADTFAGVLEISTNSEVAAALDYLQNNDLGDAGATVTFDVGSDAFVFTQGDDAGTDDLDVVVRLEGTQVDSLVTTNGTGEFDLYIV